MMIIFGQNFNFANIQSEYNTRLKAMRDRKQIYVHTYRHTSYTYIYKIETQAIFIS